MTQATSARAAAPSIAPPRTEPSPTVGLEWVGQKLGLGAEELGTLKKLADHARAKMKDPEAVDQFIRGATTQLIEPSGNRFKDALTALISPAASRRAARLMGESIAPFIPEEVKANAGAIGMAFARGFFDAATKTPGDLQTRFVAGVFGGLVASLKKIGEVMSEPAKDGFQTGPAGSQLPEGPVSSTQRGNPQSPMMTMIAARAAG